MSKETLSFRSPDELKAYLKMQGIPVEEYGTGAAKTIQHLYKEVMSGGCILVKENGKVLRRVRTATIRVYYSDNGRLLYLREVEQVFHEDKRGRTRDWMDWSVSEKLEYGEEPAEAAIRGMAEELGIDGELDLRADEPNTVTADSQSYPGLQTQYMNNFFTVFLSPDQFDPLGYEEHQDDKITRWRWVEAG